MFKSQNKTSGAGSMEGFPSRSNLPPDESTWKPSLRRMTKRMFSSKNSAPSPRPSLPQAWVDGHHIEPSSQNGTPHTTLRELHRGPSETPQERRSFIQRAISKRDTEQSPARTRRAQHVAKPSVGESSRTFSTSSTELTHVARDSRYPDTDAETSPSSTLPRDLPTPVRTSYASKRAGMDFTSTGILLPTIYQPPGQNSTPKNDDIDVSLDSFPAPPFEPYHTNPNLNPHVSSPIIFQPAAARGMNPITKIPSTESPRRFQRLSISEDPQVYQISGPDPIPEPTKTDEQLNDDFQQFLAKSRRQAKNRNSMFSTHTLQQQQSQEPYSTPRASRILDNFTFSHNLKRSLSKSQPQSQSQPQPKTQLQTQPQPQPQTQTQTFPKTRPYSLQNAPPTQQPNLPIPQIQIHNAPPTTTTTNPPTTQPSTPQLGLQSRFSLDSRQHQSASATSSLYGKMKDYIFPFRTFRSRPTSTYSSNTHSPTAADVPRLYRDKERGRSKEKEKEREREGGGTAGRSGRWSRMGSAIKRSLSIDREKDAEIRVRMGVDVSDRDDLRDEDGAAGKRRSKIMPTSRGLDRYNRTVNGGYWR